MKNSVLMAILALFVSATFTTGCHETVPASAKRQARVAAVLKQREADRQAAATAYDNVVPGSLLEIPGKHRFASVLPFKSSDGTRLMITACRECAKNLIFKTHLVSVGAKPVTGEEHAAAVQAWYDQRPIPNDPFYEPEE